MGKKGDLSNFERGRVVGVCSQSAQLLGFSHTTISRVYKEWSGKGKKGLILRFLMFFFKRRLFCSPRLHLFDSKSNIVKYYCNLKLLFSM